MSDRNIIDQIDDVIAWHGSADSMRWTATPPPALPVPYVDSEAARQLVVNLGVQVQAFAEAIRPVAEQMMRAFGEIGRASAAIVNSPQMRELVEVQRLERRAMKSDYDRRRRARGRRR